MVEFHKHGVQMRYLHPGGSGFASQHSKSWLVDGRVYLTGSVNLTHGGLEHNIEDLLIVTEKNAIAGAAASFETQWARATPVSDDDITTMTETWEARNNAKQRRSSSRSVSRSLSVEMQEEATGE